MRRPLKTLSLLGAAALLAQSLIGCSGSRPGSEVSARHTLAALAPGEDLPALNVVEADLRSGDVVSPRQLDIYIAQAFSPSPDSSLLWSSFRKMLAGHEHYQTDTARAHLERHLALSELLYRDAPGRDAGLRARAEHALRWWMDQETAPASGVNERLVSHLERVTYAWKHYPSVTAASGLDARGETLVRYGTPSRTRSVNFNEADLLQSYMRQGLQIRQADFPANEFWVYDRLGTTGMFLFVEGARGTGYLHGSVNDLLPRQLKNRGVTGSARGPDFAFAALRTLRYIYSQLALFHPSYSSRFDIVSGYVSAQEERAFSQRAAGRQQSVGVGYDAITQTLQTVLTRNDSEDERLEARRAAALPTEYARVDRPVMPIGMRAIRQLTSPGTTRVRVYWSLEANSFAACVRETGAVPEYKRSRLVSYSPGYGVDTVVIDSTTAAAPWDHLYRYDFELGAPIELLALQIDGTTGDRGESFIGSCAGVVRSDPFAPLDLRSTGVEISDLLPFYVDDVVQTREEFARSGFSVDDLRPYLPSDLSGRSGLGIFFEVYALTDLDDTYMIEYEIVKRSRAGILRRGKTRASIYQARQAVVDRRLPAAFLIDQAEWRDADEIDVVVTVTNLDTGAAVERTLSFSVPSAASARLR
jgi:hypothetical protein